MTTTNIYALIDPITLHIRYIGKANNVSQRYRAHLNKARKHQAHKLNWINSLKKQKLKPILYVLDVVPIEDWIFWEEYWISQAKAWGCNLLNYTNGGDGCTFANQTSFKKGNKPWNSGTAKPKILKGNKGKTDNSIRNYFKLEHQPWNKNSKGIKLKPDKNVHQYSKDKKEFIKTWNTAKHAADFLNINEEGIGQCARGTSKSSGQFWWTYNKI